MCGIAGYFGLRVIDSSSIDACLRLMRRRGPDHAALGQWMSAVGRNVYLLHARLNIIDMSDRANQPFQAAAKWLVYNGELYNYLELRRRLKEQIFTTESDTEVLLRTLVQLGWQGLDRCEGMWAFACWDAQAEALLLARDRFGEKPLYLYRDGTGLYFGSEIKFIAALLGKRLSVNFNHLRRYLVNGYKSLYKARENFFCGIEELPPGAALAVDASGAEELRYYWKPQVATDARLGYAEAVEGVRERLLDSVRLRLRADVPMAFCMSGGIDSNSLISIAKKVFSYDVHGFTIVNADTRYDEQELVEHSVSELGIRHTAIPVEAGDFLPRLRALVCQHDAPVYTISYYAHWLLMESIAAHGYRISVSGTGADELLSGYYDHHNAYLYEVRCDPELYEKSLGAWRQHIQPLVRNPYLSDPEVFFARPGFRGHIFLDAAGFTSYLRQPWEEPFAERAYCPGLLRNRMLNELFHEIVPPILHEDDLNAMYFSIENRSPFLDRALFEFCYRIPTPHLIRDGYAKVILRDAMRGIVPDCVLDNRRKVGFNAPIHAFLDPRDPQVRGQLLDHSPIFAHVRRDRIEQLLAKAELPNSESKFLFYFLNSKIFLEEFAA